MTLYNCRTIPDGGFAITKFTDDLVPEATYAVTNATCTCAASRRPTCRHRKMLGKFFEFHHVNDGWFYRHENGMWHRPIHPPPEVDVASAGEGPGQSPLAANQTASPSVKLPEQASGVIPGFKRRF